MKRKIVYIFVFLTLVLTAFAIVSTNVNADDEPDFSISVFPSSQTVAPGEYTTFVVTVTSLNGFSSPVSLSISGLPDGAYANFNPTPVTPTGYSTLTISTIEGVITGNYPITLIGTGGGLTHTTATSITIDFGLIPMKFGTFAGQVTDMDTGLPIAEAKVFIYSSYNYYMRPGGGENNYWGKTIEVTTDSGGNYLITGVPLNTNNAPKIWTVGAHADGYSGNYHVATAVADTIVTVDIALCHASITGWVIDANTNQPVPDANIVAVSSAVSSYVYAYQFTTDENGYYSLPNLPLAEDNTDRTYVVTVSAPEYCTAEQEATISCGSNIFLNISLVPKCYGTFIGRVTDIVTEEPIAGAKVYIYYEPNPHQYFNIYPEYIRWYTTIEVTTDTNGEYVMNNVPLIPCNNPKVWVLGFHAEGYSETYHVATAIANTEVTVDMAMCPPNNITGVVIDANTGMGIMGAKITARSDITPYSYVRAYNFYTDEQGGYTLPNIALGEDDAARTYSIVVTHPEYYNSETQAATVSCGINGTSDFSLIPKLYGAFNGRVIDAETDDPIAGATVFIYPRYHYYYKYPTHSNWYKTLEVTTDADGYYTMPNVPLNAVNLPTDYIIGFHADGYSSTYLGATAVANTDVTVDIALCHATITGKVIDATTGEPIVGADLYAWSYIQSNIPFYIYSQTWIREFTTDDQGVYTLPNLPLGYDNEPRLYNVRASASGYWPQTKTGTIFCGGIITIDFAGPEIAFGSVTGTVTDCVTGEPIEGAFVGSTFGVIAYTDEDGVYTLTDIELGPGGSSRTGNVTVEAEGYVSQTMSVEVNAEEPSILDFSLCPPIQFYYLTVGTDPAGLTTFAEEGWYEQGTDVEVTAPSIDGYTFLYWDIDGTNQADGENPITVTMNSAHTATAHYFEWVTVSGIKYEDSDGTQTTTNPIENWAIELWNESSLLNSTTTDVNGYYEFVVIEPGYYEIKEVLPIGWTKLYPGDIVYGDGSSVFGYSVTIENSVDLAGNDFMNFEWLYIYGHKYFDGNGDGTWNNDEPYLDGWTITLDHNDDTVSVITGDGTWDTGYYEFTLKEPGTYMVSEGAPDIWTKTQPTGDSHQVIAQSGGDVELNFGNWFEGGLITDSSLCYFDIDEADGQQFRVIFTPDIANDPNLYKVTATNPGQFYYHVFYSGQDITGDFEITLPSTFETQGATPVHVYSSVIAGPDGCLIPEDDISDAFDIGIDRNLLTVTPFAEYDGFIYITVHCDYALKQTGGYELQYYYDENGVVRGNAIKDPDTASIYDMIDHLFSATGPDSFAAEDTIQNRNEFKKFRGIIGFLTDSSGNPIIGSDIIITGPSIEGGTLSLQTDIDGFYGYSFFHLGRPALYSVEFVGYTTLYIVMRAGHFAEVSYQVS
ncbi:hypothetical protein AYK25_02565 [Thermoplasmatales archaeon SM1-50]|nr:MAG: hypothetical protein AYK25_02565 [Thermoplasmatales archaeon SM1-50]